MSVAKLGKINLHVIKESWSDDADIPSYAVEDGLNISDHVEDKPNVLTLTGILFKDKKYSVAAKIKELKKYKNGKSLLTYVGRRTGKNFKITRFSYDSESKIANGHNFSMTLQEIRIAKKATKTKKKGAKKKSSAGRKQTSNKKDSPVYHKTKKGDCYIKLGKQYGTKWTQIQAWNKYPARRIPIGVKLRVR